MCSVEAYRGFKRDCSPEMEVSSVTIILHCSVPAAVASAMEHGGLAPRRGRNRSRSIDTHSPQLGSVYGEFPVLPTSV
jgi:hypothetical protein